MSIVIIKYHYLYFAFNIAINQITRLASAITCTIPNTSIQKIIKTDYKRKTELREKKRKEDKTPYSMKYIHT